MILHMTEYERRMHILVWQYFLLEKKNQPKEPPLDKCNRHYTDVCNAIHETVKHYHMYTYDITRQITTTSTYNIYHTPV